MFRIEFMLRTSHIQRYTLVFPAALLILAFLGQVNKLYILGAPCAAGCIVLGKIQYINKTLLICAIGFIMDMVNLMVHRSASSWLYIKAVQFVMRSLVCIFQFACMTAVYCYLKQEQSIRANKENSNWNDEQADQIMSDSEQSERPSTSNKPSNEPTNSELTAVNTSPQPSA